MSARFQTERRDREARDAERENVHIKLRSEIAGQSTQVLVLLNSGGLAATLTWLQSLPTGPNTNSCSYVLSTNLPVVAALLLAGVLAATGSYLLRYLATLSKDIHNSKSTRWMAALALAGLCIVVAGSWASYAVTHCKSMAFKADMDMQIEKSMASYRLAVLAGGSKKAWTELDARMDQAHNAFQLAILEGTIKDIGKAEEMLERTKKTIEDLQRYIQLYGSGPNGDYQRSLQDALDLQKKLETQLRGSAVVK